MANPFDMSAPPTPPADRYLSAHLRLAEIRCPCGCQYGMYPDEFDQRLADNHEIIRQAAGNHPLPCGSGCRCPAHNRGLRDRGIPSHPNSDHMKGRGIDIHRPIGMSAVDFGALALELYDAGKLIDVTSIGIYGWGVHLSVGSRTCRATVWGPLEDEAMAKFKANRAPVEKPQATPAPKPKTKPAKKAAKKRKD